MKRCTALCSRSFQVAGLGAQSRRCLSYDKSALTKEALLQQVESGLGKDAKDQPIKVNADAKTIGTATGDLPISPIMDPAWMQARRRQKKDKATRPTGRLRRKLTNNPYALALITPMRRDLSTNMKLPRYFFQDFELVKHPDLEEKKAWWVPGPLSTESVVPKHDAKRVSKTRSEEEDQETGTEEGEADVQEPQSQRRGRVRRAPIAGYTLARKGVVDAISKKQSHPLLLAQRSGTAFNTAPPPKEQVWREDMGDVVLNMMRRTAVDALLHRATRSEADYKFIQPCADWDEAKKAFLRGCVLWIPKEDDGKSHQYATVDVDDAKFGGKMAVHNLNWLLGEEEMKRLRDSSALFRDNELLVLRQWRTEAMIKLHQLLWRLQGYLYEPKKSD